MANNYYNFPTAFVPGTKVRSEQVNVQYQGVESGFDLLPTDPVASIIGTAWLGTDVQGATVNDYLITTPDPQSALANGQRVAFFATHTNTGAATINVDGLGVVNLVDNDGSVLGGGNIVLGQYYEVVYDNANTQFTRSLAATQTVPVGLDTELLFNNAGTIEGIPTMTWDGSVVNIVTVSGDQGLYIQQDDPNTEAFEIYTDQAHDGIVLMTIDNGGATGPVLTLSNLGSGGAIQADAAISVLDNVQLQAGTGLDFTFEHTGALSLIDNQTGDILIRNSANGNDITFNVNSTGVPQQTLEVGVLGSAVVALNADGNQRLITNDQGILLTGYITDGTGYGMSEQATVPAIVGANNGFYWVRDDSPTVAMFTDSTNVDFVLNSVTATPGGANTNVQFNNGGALDGSANFTFDGTNVVIAGNINSLGIDDNATLEVLELGDSVMTVGRVTATTDHAIDRAVNDGSMTLYGGVNGQGGGFIGYGSAHASFPGDFQLRSGTNAFLDWDESAGELQLLTGTAGKTLTATFDTSQNTTLAGSLYLAEVAASGDVANFGQLYVNAGNTLIYRSEGGVETDLLVAAAAPGAPVNSVQFNVAGVFTGNAGMLFDNAATTTPQLELVPIAGLTTGALLSLSANLGTFDGPVLSVLNDNIGSTGDAVNIVSDSGGRALYVNQQNNLIGVEIEQTFNTNLLITTGGSSVWGIDINMAGQAGGAGIRITGSDAASTNMQSRVSDSNSADNNGLQIIHEFGAQNLTTHMLLTPHPNIGGEPLAGAGRDGGVILDDGAGMFWHKVVDGGGLSNKWWSHEVSKKFNRVLTTSGTLHTIVSDMPTWCTEVIIIMSGISTNGVSPIKVTIGPSGSPLLTGYAGRVIAHDASNTHTSITNSSGFFIGTVFTAATTFSGTMRFTWSDLTEIWNCEFAGFDSTGRVTFGAGSIDITGNVDTIELDTNTHSDTFDAGEFTVILRGAGRSSEVF